MVFHRLAAMKPSARRQPSAPCSLRVRSSASASKAPVNVLSRWVTILYSNTGRPLRSVGGSDKASYRTARLAPGGLGFGEGLEELLRVEVGWSAHHLGAEALGEFPAQAMAGAGVELPATLQEPAHGDELVGGDVAHVPGGVAVGDGEVGEGRAGGGQRSPALPHHQGAGGQVTEPLVALAQKDHDGADGGVVNGAQQVADGRGEEADRLAAQPN